ncbi:MAG: M20 family metallo-hydrolase [Caldilinea sp.]|nr:M20 family metallo-hydrolase [Caldilinea sp.]MDW8438895.1 M20 family metallo-hydrolase [Caldilineaceae bacterium]
MSAQCSEGLPAIDVRSLVASFDGEQLLADLDALGAIGWKPGAGLQRLAYGDADLEARRWVLTQMQALGMQAWIDPAGNVIGHLPGSEPLPALAIGSHTDSVPGGGKFDGALGVLAGLACVRTLRSQDVQLRHPLLLIDFAAEEATTSASPTGSLSFVGGLTQTALDGPSWDGRSTVALLTDHGFNIAAMIANRPPMPIAAFLELHIEQGDRLASAGVPIGIVEGIVGIRRYYVHFQGQANHAGTTDMKRRRDALVMAAPFILAVREAAMTHGIVGTVGRIEVHPNTPNVIPGRVMLDVEIRGLDDAVLDRVEAILAVEAARCGGTLHPGHRKEPVLADPKLMEAIERGCEALGLRTMRMPSGAGHDAMNLAAICPYAMLFAPSEQGVSHAPDEWTQPHDCINAARALLAAVLEVDAMPDV